MKKINLFICTLIFSFSFSEKSFSNEVLTVDELVKSSIKNYPIIFAQYDRIAAAKAELIASKGAFDINLNQKYKDNTRGYYDGKSYDAEFEKYLGPFNSTIYGGYRKSYGNFPDYEGYYDTGSSGELRGGIKFSLLKDRDIDSRRLSVILSNLTIEEAEIELERIKLQIARDATQAYWNWVSSGNVLKIYDNLYQISLTRQKQLEVKSKKGDIARIIVVENQKNLLKRKSALLKMRREFESSSIYLALFWRDNNGKTIKPDIENLPALESKSLDMSKFKQLAIDEEQILLQRPEIRMINVELQKQENELKYAKNLLNPELDVEFGASKDQGSANQEIGQSRNFINLNFSVPLQQREAKGKISAAKSKLSAIKNKKSLLQDQIKQEVAQVKLKIFNVKEIYELLEQEVEMSKTLQKAELEKFNHGASNFFLVNMREQDLALSKAARIEAFKDFKNFIADYNLAIFNYDEIKNY